MTAVSERIALRPLTPAHFDAVYDTVNAAFHNTADDRADEASIWEPGRMIGAFDGDRLVGTAGAYTRAMTLPGGPQPVACVTGVAVATEFTRQGLLTRMMRHQLAELHEKGEPAAALWASESGIYGRFGYGLAARHARTSVNLREVRLLRPPSRQVRNGWATDEGLRADVGAVYERVRTRVVGHLDRRGGWAAHRFYDPEHHRHGTGPLRIVVHDGPGGPDGYALYSVESNWKDDGPFGSASVRELRAENGEAEQAVWSFLLGLDLVGEVTARITPPDNPLPLLVDHPRRVRMALADNLWVRIVDVGRALAARTYGAPIDVVLDVEDEFCPWNSGRWRLEGGPDGARCERADSPADLALTSADLGAAYLGGTSLVALAAAGRVVERRTGALRRAAIAFTEPGAPYCPEIF